jgi:hypothetical protein
MHVALFKHKTKQNKTKQKKQNKKKKTKKTKQKKQNKTKQKKQNKTNIFYMKTTKKYFFFI